MSSDSSCSWPVWPTTLLGPPLPQVRPPQTSRWWQEQWWNRRSPGCTKLLAGRSDPRWQGSYGNGVWESGTPEKEQWWEDGRNLFLGRFIKTEREARSRTWELRNRNWGGSWRLSLEKWQKPCYQNRKSRSASRLEQHHCSPAAPLLNSRINWPYRQLVSAAGKEGRGSQFTFD